MPLDNARPRSPASVSTLSAQSCSFHAFIAQALEGVAREISLEHERQLSAVRSAPHQPTSEASTTQDVRLSLEVAQEVMLLGQIGGSMLGDIEEDNTCCQRASGSTRDEGESRGEANGTGRRPQSVVDPAEGVPVITKQLSKGRRSVRSGGSSRASIEGILDERGISTLSLSLTQRQKPYLIEPGISTEIPIESPPNARLVSFSIEPDSLMDDVPSQCGDHRIENDSDAHSDDTSSVGGPTLAALRKDSLTQFRFPLLPAWTQDESRGGHSQRKSLKSRRQSSAWAAADFNDSVRVEDEKPLSAFDRILTPYVMQPNTGWRMCWDGWMLLLVGFECIVFPLQLIGLEQTKLAIVAAWIVRCCWTADIPLSCLTGYVRIDGTQETLPCLVVKRYIKGWFLIDAIIVLSDWSEVVLPAARVGKAAKVFRIMRVMRLARLMRFKRFPGIFRMVLECVINADLIPLVANIVFIVVVFAWLNHVMACLWHHIGDCEPAELCWIRGHELDAAGRWQIYATAFHWSLQQFQGTANVWPWNQHERILAVMFGVFTFVTAAFFVSSLTSSLTNFGIATSQDSNKLNKLRIFLIDNGVSNATLFRVQRNAEHALLEAKKDMPETSIELFTAISEPLQMEIHFDMHMNVLSHHPFFKLYSMTSPRMMRHVCHRAIAQLRLHLGDLLFSPGESMQHPKMFFVKDGEMEYKHATGEVTRLTAGQWAAEGGLWTAWTHCGSIVAASSKCTLIMLEVGKFQHIGRGFQSDIDFARNYGQAFVDYLSSVHDEDLTDLDDPGMNIEFLAHHACRHEVKSSLKRKSSGLGLSRKIGSLASGQSFHSVLSRGTGKS